MKKLVLVFVLMLSLTYICKAEKIRQTLWSDWNFVRNADIENSPHVKSYKSVEIRSLNYSKDKVLICKIIKTSTNEICMYKMYYIKNNGELPDYELNIPIGGNLDNINRQFNEELNKIPNNIKHRILYCMIYINAEGCSYNHTND